MHIFNRKTKSFFQNKFLLILTASMALLSGCDTITAEQVQIDYSSPSSVVEAANLRDSAGSAYDAENADNTSTSEEELAATSLKSADVLVAKEDIQTVADSTEVQYNPQTDLSVPTFVTQIDGLYFIVDCYHNEIIYSDSLDTYISNWYVMTSDVTQAHTIASDGDVYLVDDTENNRVLVYEKCDGKFINTQVFNEIGNRPHYTVYDNWTDTFYTWSSTTGELYCFRHGDDSNQMYLTEIRSIERLNSTYVRSFTIVGDLIYFVSGVTGTTTTASILCCDLSTLDVLAEYAVPDTMAGMVQITPIDDYFYITISTDATGSQDAATIIRTNSLEGLMTGDYEDIYATYFVGGGTPYYISKVDDTYFLTEHRLAGHSVWSFNVVDNEIQNVISIY